MTKPLDMTDVFEITRKHMKEETKEVKDIMNVFEQIAPHVILSEGHKNQVLDKITKDNQEKVVSAVFSLSSRIGLVYNLDELTTHVVNTVKKIIENFGLPESYTKRIDVGKDTSLLVVIILLRKLAKNS